MSSSDYSRGTQTSSGTSGSAPSLADTATNIGSDIKDGALDGARSAQRRTSESMHTFAEAIRKAGDELQDKDEGPVAQLLSHAAGGLDQMSRAIGQKRLEDIVTDVRSFGREHPGAFVMGSVLLGVALGRFAQTAAAAGSSASQGSHRGSNMGAGRGSGMGSSMGSDMASGSASHGSSSYGGSDLGSKMGSGAGSASSHGHSTDPVASGMGSSSKGSSTTGASSAVTSEHISAASGDKLTSGDSEAHRKDWSKP